MMKHWNRLPGEAVEATSLEVLKDQAGWGLEPPDPVEGVPWWGGLELDGP